MLGTIATIRVFVMPNATIRDVLEMQRDIRQYLLDGSWAVDLEDLKQPAGIAPESTTEPVHMRVIDVIDCRVPVNRH